MSSNYIYPEQIYDDMNGAVCYTVYEDKKEQVMKTVCLNNRYMTKRFSKVQSLCTKI